MKRHESLLALSREHHVGLLFCWKIRQGVKQQVLPERIQSYVKYFWDNHLLQHFEEEETYLFPLLQDSLVQQALSEHALIRQSMANIVSTKQIRQDQLSTLAGAIDDHIRFEERTLFPHMEKTLPAEKLAVLSHRITEIHSTGSNDDYPDAFWIKKGDHSASSL